jgi:REP element-mobilizing transposase RayT
MTVARRSQIDLTATPYYHCVNRCVRRAFLCGEDKVSGRSYEHRKGWIVEKIKSLSEIFAMDVCAYAVMSNHYHVVLRVDDARADDWELGEVVERWTELFKGHVLVERWRQNDVSSQAEKQAVGDMIEEWRKRLTDISWFMRCLNEAIARQANEEDNCGGRFWEGRFKSQALLDESALLSCMMYVDLNPIRAGICETLENSEYTSIQERIHAHSAKLNTRMKKKSVPAGRGLVPFAQHDHSNRKLSPLDFDLNDYLALIDWTGRAIRDDKKGAIPDHVVPLVVKLGIEQDHWLVHIRHFESRYPRVAGSFESIKRCAAKLEQSWFQGCGAARRAYI